jgi:hypothetical protein
MINFDSPTRETCVVRETRTNTPLQALNLMNDTIYLEASRKLAERMLARPASERLDWALRVVLARAPRHGESGLLQQALAKFSAYYSAHPDAAEVFLKQGDSPRNPGFAAPELAAYTGVASLLMNMDEAITKE